MVDSPAEYSGLQPTVLGPVIFAAIVVGPAEVAVTAAESAAVRAAMLAIEDWILDEESPTPTRAEIAAAVRLTARTLPQLAPGSSVEVRVPPFVAVQCIEGPRHTRGTPPNVVETTPRTWLRLAAGVLTFDQAVRNGQIDVSGARAAEIAELLPITPGEDSLIRRTGR